MRVFAALDPEVAAASNRATASESRFFLHIMRQCYLLGIGRDDGPTLLEQIRKLPADRQWLWTEVLKARLSRTDLDRNHHNTLTCRTHGSRGLPQVTERDSVSLCQECGSEHQPWQGIAMSREAADCIEQLSKNEVPRGVSRDELYARAFRTVARASDSCVIIDRYAGVRMTRKHERSGVAWFGNRLVEDGVKRIVLVTATGKATSAQIATSAGNLTSVALKRALKIETRPDSAFGRHAHDRFILFQAGRSGCTFSVGKGLEVFEFERVRQESSISSSDGAGVARILSDLHLNVGTHFSQPVQPESYAAN